MFAQSAVQVLAEAKQIEAMPSTEKGLSTHALRERITAKGAAVKDIATFSALLYPEDEAA